MLSILLVGCAGLELPQRPLPPPTMIVVKEDVKQVPYPVKGTTLRSLRQSIKDVANDVHASQGGGFHGLTRYTIQWTSKTRWEGNKCGLESAEVEVNALVFTPSWDAEGARASLKERWDTYIVALTAHEEDHKHVAVAHANALAAELRALEPTDTCEEIKESVRAAGQQRKAWMRAAQVAYDEETDRGVEQGARL